MKASKILIIVLLIVVVLLTCVIFVMKVYGKNGSEDKEQTYSLTLDTLYCDIKDSKSIVRINITIETNKEETFELLTKKMYIIKNNVNEIVRNKTEEELKGKDGQVSLQREIKNNLIQVFNEDSIVNVYFNEFVIQ
ncbi:MAG TPA: flagellar basal body-associated FliL family protein [Tissierellia bacterium]|nr:flagellar basal body-associated FliL family protein [Tissierellia bacterium]